MKDFTKLFAGSVLAIVLAACSQQAPEEAAEVAPTETADEFVARVNEELVELNRAGQAAAWVIGKRLSNAMPESPSTVGAYTSCIPSRRASHSASSTP